MCATRRIRKSAPTASRSAIMKARTRLSSIRSVYRPTPISTITVRRTPISCMSWNGSNSPTRGNPSMSGSMSRIREPSIRHGAPVRPIIGTHKGRSTKPFAPRTMKGSSRMPPFQRFPKPTRRIFDMNTVRFLPAVAALAIIVSGAAEAPNAGNIPFFGGPDTSWVKIGDDFIPVPSAAKPVSFDPAHPYQPNNDKGLQVTFRVADLTNPILKPWAVAQMKKSNDEVIAGGQPFRARTSCVPGGVPGYLIYGRLEPPYFAQSASEVVLMNQADAQIRHVYLNVPHSANPKPSWYGESVGHYEGGDTLVIDTIAQNDKTFVDDYRTPHTSQIHVVERFTLTDGGKTLRVSFTVDDPGAYNTPWSASQIYRRSNQ